MNLFRQTGPRTGVWVVVLIGVAAAAGFAHASWWVIGLVEFAAWCFVAVVERSLSRPRIGMIDGRPTLPRSVSELQELSSVRVLLPNEELPAPARDAEVASGPSHEPEPEPEPEPEAAPAQAEPEPEPVLSPAAIVLAPPTRQPERKVGLFARAPQRSVELPEVAPPQIAELIQWNVWTLERIARERAAGNEELSFLVVYLRDYANPAGLLPPTFDPLVRESFGPLLSSALV